MVEPIDDRDIFERLGIVVRPPSTVGKELVLVKKELPVVHIMTEVITPAPHPDILRKKMSQLSIGETLGREPAAPLLNKSL